jgi:hypothetical protein
MPEPERRPLGEWQQAGQSPQITELSKLRQDLYSIIPNATIEEIVFAAGYNEALGLATYLAKAEELRVRKFIESNDGYCLDTEEEREKFIQDLYERRSTDTDS